MADKKKRRKLNPFLRVMINLVFVVFVITVFVMPFFASFSRFLGNDISNFEGEGEKSDVVVNRGDTLIDLSKLQGGDPSEDPSEDPSADPSASPKETGPDETAATPEVTEPTPTPHTSDVKHDDKGGSQGSLPYVPDPIVDGVIKTPGCNIKLEPDAKNILVLGIDVRCDLTDTMIVLSICERKHTITALSLSRDAYVPFQGAVQDYLVRTGLAKGRGNYKLNFCYHLGKSINYKGGKFGNSGIDFLCHIITEMMPDANMHIDDYIFINPDGLEDFVDYFGGVDVYFSEDRWVMTGDGTTKLKYTKGYHHLSGKEAVSFVRTRARYNETGRISSTGDPYRKANQLRFVKDLASQIITVENVGRINEIFTEASKFMYHSISTTSQLSGYTKMALDYAQGKYALTSYVVSGKSIDPLGDGVSYVNLMY